MDLLDAHGQALEVFDRSVHHIGLSDWDSPTPCTDWTVRDLVNHLVYDQLWVPELLAGKTIAEVGDKYDGDQLHDDPIEAWTTSSQAARAALLAPGALEGDVHLSFGDAYATEYAWQLTLDAAVHGWDLATAIGASADVIGDELAKALLEYVEPRVAEWSGSSWFGEPVPVGDHADPQTRLVSLLGRRTA